jgi:uncharacterized protein (TIGR02453 family)
MAVQFEGFPADAIRFFKNLEAHNNKDWFQKHKDEYELSCREPMKQLTSELSPRFGAVKISRINQDMRFVADRAPYKTRIFAGVGSHYLSLSKDGLYVAGGMYKPDPVALERFRNAVDDERSGSTLAKLVSVLRRKGFRVDTHDRVATAPRGYAASHPRIELIRMKDIFAGKQFEPGPALASRKILDLVSRAMLDVAPLNEWLKEHVGRSLSQ